LKEIEKPNENRVRTTGWTVTATRL